MGIHKVGWLLVPCAVAGIAGVAQASKIRVFTQKVSAETVCGTEYGQYECSTTLNHMRLRQADIALERSGSRPNHLSVLGMVYNDLAATKLSLFPCGSGDTNIFAASDTSPQTEPTGFVYKKKTDTRVDAGLQADVKNALVAAGVTGPLLDQLQAEFNASYRRAAGSEHNMTGQYYRLALKDDVVRAILNPATTNSKAKTCAQTLRTVRGSHLIYSIAVIKLESASYASSVATDVAVDFAAKVRAKAPTANIAAVQGSVSSAVRTSLNTTLGTEYRVISWDYLDASSFRPTGARS